MDTHNAPVWVKRDADGTAVPFRSYAYWFAFTYARPALLAGREARMR